MDVVTITIDDAIKNEVEAAFRQELGFAAHPLTLPRDPSAPPMPHEAPGISKLKQLQSAPVTQVIHPNYIDIVKAKMPEAIAALKRLNSDDPPIIRIKNAPIAAPFGKGDDTQYQNQFADDHPPITDRLPIAESVLMALSEAAGLKPDFFKNDHHGKVWSYPTPLAAGKGQNGEEHGAKTIFPIHTDGSMNRAPSEIIMLAAGIGAKDAKTIVVDQPKLYQAMQRYDQEHGTQVVATLKEPIFQHIPGTSSTDASDILVAPVLNESPSGKLFFRGNLAVNPTGERIGLVAGLSHAKQTLAKTAITVFEQLAKDPENNVTLTLEQSEATFMPNGPHYRTSFRNVENPAEQRYIARFGLKTDGYAERFKNIAYSDTVAAR